MNRPDGTVATIGGMRIDVAEGLVLLRSVVDPTDRFVLTPDQSALLSSLTAVDAPCRALSQALKLAARASGAQSFTLRSGGGSDAMDLQETYEGIPRPKATGEGSPWRRQITDDLQVERAKKKAAKRAPRAGGYKKR